MTVIVTGVAGFIGFHVASRLLADGNTVIGIDNLNEYYDVRLKSHRLGVLLANSRFTFVKLDISDDAAVRRFPEVPPGTPIFHLAAQPGVRHSINNPRIYLEYNIVGQFNILELARRIKSEHLVYASSSSVYGETSGQVGGSSICSNTDRPVSFYAATKKASEVMAHSYGAVYGLRTTGLRLFTVYGPYGRPDMAYYSFAKAISGGIPIRLFNHGKLTRDFTFIDDVVESAMRLWRRPGERSQIFNVGCGAPARVRTLVQLLEQFLGKQAIVENAVMQVGDVTETHCDNAELKAAISYVPSTTLEHGLKRFTEWFVEYHGNR